MFDMGLPGLDELGGVDEHALVAGWARVEAAAAARRLAVIAELVDRRASREGVTSRWVCDGWDGVAAQVAAAAGWTRGRASNQMYVATALRHRLPRIAGLFADGSISAAVVGTIVWHTTLIEDLGVLEKVDAALAEQAHWFGRLSEAKTITAIHAIIEEHDRDAVRRTRNAARDRDLVVDGRTTESGTTGLFGRLYAHDAVVLDRRLAAMAHGVCDDDPRTLAQRRADALGALAAGADRLRCACDNPGCPASAEEQPGPATVVYVLADAEAVTTPPDPHLNGQAPQCPPPRPGAPLIGGPEPEPESERPAPAPPPVKPRPAQIIGGPLIPASVLAELIRTGATVTPLRLPGPDSAPERHYRPSAKLAAFIRARDLTCRFPGCDQPATVCDIDHATAWGDGGLTHPSNLRCLCRHHHLLKTFWGWRDRQRPNGSIDWTSPTGHTYTTHPGARLLFPVLCQPTGTLPAPVAPADARLGCRTAMMPTRTRTRTQNRAAAIKTERALNNPRPG